MAPPKVRADYDQLKAMAGSFASQAEAVQQTLAHLKQQTAVLQGGDWVGQGAAAFYQEMGDQVVPAVQRLARALESAQQTTLKMSQIMGQAEADAAKVLRGEGGSPAGALGAGASAGPAASAIAGAGGPAPTAAPQPRSGGTSGSGSAAAASTPQQIAQSIRQTVDTIQSLYGDAVAAAAAMGAIQGAQGQAAPVQAAVIDALLHDGSAAVRAVALKAAEEAAVDRELAQFSPGVRALVKQSPTLRGEIYQAEQKGFGFINDPTETRFLTSQSAKKVGIGTRGMSDETIVRHLAHEASHSANDVPMIQPAAGQARQDYIDKGVDIKLHDEGRAELNNVKARMEIMAGGGPDIGRSSPAGHDPYQTIYNDLAAGSLNWDQAVDRAATAMAGEHPVMAPSLTYRDMYAREFGNHFDHP